MPNLANASGITAKADVISIPFTLSSVKNQRLKIAHSFYCAFFHHEIVNKSLQQTCFTGLEQTALTYPSLPSAKYSSGLSSC